MAGIIRKVCFCLLVICMMGTAYGQSSPVILTLYGKFEQSNRDGMDEFADGFLNYHELEFDRAFEIDFATLAKMKQYQFTISAEGWDKSVKLAGPLLADVLNIAGFNGEKVSLMALDGYAVELTSAEISARNWILAISKDDKPLALGGRGPLWLVHDTGGKKASADEEGKWVWSVFAIRAE